MRRENGLKGEVVWKEGLFKGGGGWTVDRYKRGSGLTG